MEGVPALVEAGVTDFTGLLPVPAGQEAAEAALRPVVAAFREAVGRTMEN